MIEKTLFDKYQKIFEKPPEVFSLAPGRVNIIGEHTDYNLGYVLPAAIDKRIFFLAAKRPDRKVCVWAEDFKEKRSFSIEKFYPSKRGHWMNYIKGIFFMLEERNCSLQGVDALICGEIPRESGLSSSAALEVSVIKGLDKLFSLALSREWMARAAQRVENEYVGVSSGIMDPFVSLFGKKGHALFLDCESLQFEHIPFHLDRERISLLVYDSGIRRELSSSAYNERRRQSAQALELLKMSGFQSFKTVTLRDLESVQTFKDAALKKRARHVISENDRVTKAVQALRKSDFEQLGDLLFESHKSLRDDYEVSCPELDLLDEVGRTFSGCLGARLTGAGFGGSGIALVKDVQVPEFKKKIVQAARERQFPIPSIYKVRVGEGSRAFPLNMEHNS